jgi:histone-lysine N-methyltransferase SETD2
MPDDGFKQESLELEVRGMNLKEEGHDVDMDNDSGATSLEQEPFARVAALRSSASTPTGLRRPAQSPASSFGGSQSMSVMNEQETTVGGDVSIKLEEGKPPKLSRSTTQKVEKRAARLWFDHEDATAEACSTFDKLIECTYANKNLGITEHALECDCSEEWGKQS